MKRLLLALACSIGMGMAFSASAINSGGCLNGCGMGKAKCLAKASTPQQKQISGFDPDAIDDALKALR